MDVFISFLDLEKSRDYDNSCYVIERRKKGNKPKEEEYVFKKQGGGFQHCIPSGLLLEGEKVHFAGLLMRLTVVELVGTARENGASSAAGLTGASLYLEAGGGGETTLEEYPLGGQQRL